MKTHTGEVTNECNQCDFASSQASYLKVCLKTHSGEKSNKCNQCDFACFDPSSLSQHLKMHSGEKSNKCIYYNLASSWAGHLRRHLKTHSGEKTNKCNQCEMSTMHQSSQGRSVNRLLRFGTSIMILKVVNRLLSILSTEMRSLHPLLDTVNGWIRC